ncbi:RING finger protein 222 [Clupea harengus]|uniref:RING finger protein 222 n=1 Tax=Clupea harengus TaxID=7950 RepID=A0A6P3VUX6_CLUHA|nr:RING finger protein 222 [Clupea harengus]
MEDLKTGLSSQDTDCPICYECLSGTARTLSCSHTFCHDCLVRTLVSINKDGVITRDSIVCPICRHLTFITKRNEPVVTTRLHAQTQKILEVPLLDVHQPLNVRSPNVSPLNTGRFGWITRYFRGVSLPDCIRPSKSSSEIFIISELGRPMKEDDLNVLPTTTVIVPNQRRSRPRICTTGRCLLFLLSVFSLLALITVTLPWVLLA